MKIIVNYNQHSITYRPTNVICDAGEGYNFNLKFLLVIKICFKIFTYNILTMYFKPYQLSTQLISISKFTCNKINDVQYSPSVMSKSSGNCSNSLCIITNLIIFKKSQKYRETFLKMFTKIGLFPLTSKVERSYLAQKTEEKHADIV